MPKKVTCSDAFMDHRTSPSTELLSKLKWYDGTVEPYLYSSTPKSKEGETAITNPKPLQSQKNILKYCGKVIENIVKNASNKQICCLDFLMNDMKKFFAKGCSKYRESL